jgi:hypothetical protein
MSRHLTFWFGSLVLAIFAIAACAEAGRGGAQAVAAAASELIGGEAGVPFDTGDGLLLYGVHGLQQMGQLPVATFGTGN